MVREGARLLAFAVVYTVAVRAGHWFRLDEASASPFWPASGVMIATLLTVAPRRWPSYLLVAMAASTAVNRVVVHLSLADSLASAPFDLVDSLIGATLLRRVTDFDPALPRVRDLLMLGLVSFVVATPTAAVLGALRLVHLSPSLSFATAFQTWSLGDFLGILLFAPPILATLRRARASSTPREVLGRTLVVAGAALIGFVSLSGSIRLEPGLAAYVTTPLLCYAAFRCGLRDTAYLAAFLSTVAVLSSHPHAGLGTPGLTRMASLQIFALVAVATVLVAAAIEEQRAETESHLRRERELRVSQKYEALGRLSGGVAHDFNNVLSAISVSAELIGAAPDREQTRRLASEILDAADHGSGIVRQLMRYARREVTQPVDCDLRDSLRAEAPLLERAVHGRCAIAWQVEGEPLVVRTDPTDLSRVMMNLVTNAADASGREATITVGVERVAWPDPELDDPRPHTPFPSSLSAGEYACITVADQGHGMSEEELGRIFEPFYSTKGEGTGLGLAFAYGFAMASNGSILAASAPGRGTTMRILLPLVKAAS